MATHSDYVKYVCDQISSYGTVRNKKMFGEYMVYIDEKPILLVCDNTVFIKQLDYILEFMKNEKKGFPYAGAKEHYILDIENEQLLNNVIPILIKNTLLPKKTKLS